MMRALSLSPALSLPTPIVNLEIEFNHKYNSSLFFLLSFPSLSPFPCSHQPSALSLLAGWHSLVRDFAHYNRHKEFGALSHASFFPTKNDEK